jgi:hypothetical protein
MSEEASPPRVRPSVEGREPVPVYNKLVDGRDTLIYMDDPTLVH